MTVDTKGSGFRAIGDERPISEVVEDVDTESA